MKPKRVLHRASGEAKCRCGLRRAYESHVTVKRRNQHGLLIDVVTRRSLCTVHGKAYAAKWKLEVANEAIGDKEERKQIRADVAELLGLTEQQAMDRFLHAVQEGTKDGSESD